MLSFHGKQRSFHAISRFVSATDDSPENESRVGRPTKFSEERMSLAWEHFREKALQTRREKALQA